MYYYLTKHELWFSEQSQRCPEIKTVEKETIFPNPRGYFENTILVIIGSYYLYKASALPLLPQEILFMTVLILKMIFVPD